MGGAPASRKVECQLSCWCAAAFFSFVINLRSTTLVTSTQILTILDFDFVKRFAPSLWHSAVLVLFVAGLSPQSSNLKLPPPK